MKENDVVSSICEYLEIKRYFFWRQNTTPVFSQGHFRRMPKHSKKGVPDIILIRSGLFIGLECKTDIGRQSPEQKQFESDCVKHGGKYLVVRSIDDVIAMGL